MAARRTTIRWFSQRNVPQDAQVRHGRLRLGRYPAGLFSPAAGSLSGAVSAEDATDFAERFARSCLLARSSDESEALLSWPAVSAGAARAACLGGWSCAAGDVLDEGTFFLLELGWKTFINLFILRSLRFLAPAFQGPL